MCILQGISFRKVDIDIYQNLWNMHNASHKQMHIHSLQGEGGAWSFGILLRYYATAKDSICDHNKERDSL